LWAFTLPLWAYVLVGFCPVGFCPIGFCLATDTMLVIMAIPDNGLYSYTTIKRKV